MNRWPPFHRHAYLPVNVVFGGALVLLSFFVFGLDGRELGLVWDGWGLAIGAIGGVAAASPLFGFLVSPERSRRIADRRVAGLAAGEFLYRVFIRIPVGTALFEETVFRGVLFALGLSRGPVFAVVVSSAAFGLWHIAPTLNTVALNRRPFLAIGAPSSRWRSAALAVLVTTLGGVFFSVLRTETGSLAAPTGFHAALNSTAAIAAYLAVRRGSLLRNRSPSRSISEN